MTPQGPGEPVRVLRRGRGHDLASGMTAGRRGGAAALRARPVEVPYDHFDVFEDLAHKRLSAFEAMYLRPIRETGGFEAFFTGPWAARTEEIMNRLTSEDTVAAFENYERTGDRTQIQELFQD